MSEIEHNITEVEFGPEHVGVDVTCLFNGNGKIYRVDSDKITSSLYKVAVCFGSDVYEYYTVNGTIGIYHNFRTLFIGHNVKITIEEEELPEKLICPVCGVEHDIKIDSESFCTNLFFIVCGQECPFHEAYYEDEDTPIEAIKSLIKAFKEVTM